MLENPTPPTAPTPVASQPDSSVKRYAPPNQRNRSSLNRRKSSEKNQNVVMGTRSSSGGVDHIDVVGSTNLNLLPHSSSSRPRLLPLDGCSRSDASQLLINRWALAMHYYNDTAVDLSERPVMYSGSGASAWGQFRLPHQQYMPQVNSGGSPSGSQMDFLSELRRAIRNSSAKSDN